MNLRLLCAVIAAAIPTSALAEENRLEAWFDGSIKAGIGNDAFLRFETQQRARGNNNPIGDTEVYRLWLGRKIAGVEASAGVHRGREGAQRETRLMQQLSYGLGTSGLKGRTRLEQRFIDGAPQTGWRLRQRLGVGLPLEKTGWELVAEVEGFWTLRATSATGQTGLTAVRTFAGAERSFGDLDLTLGYTRQQNIRRDAPDRVGHAPTISITLNL